MTQIYLKELYSEAIFPVLDGLPSVSLIGLGKHPHSTRGLVPHIHHGVLEIVYLQKGHQVYEVEGVEYHLYGGHMLITPPDILHSTGQYPEDKSMFVWLQIDLSDKRHFLGLEEPMASEVYESLCHLNTAVFRGASYLAKYLEDSVIAVREQNPYWRSKVQNNVMSFLFAVLEKAEEADKNRISEDIFKSLNSIEMAFPEEIPVANLARAAGLSESRFRQKFKAQVGIPPGEFYNRKRIEMATQLITDTDRSFLDIAESLGFETGDYFGRMFKKYTSKTPTQYRKDNKLKMNIKE